MTRNPLVSIVLPTYNGGSGYLDQAVQSCLNQTYSNWELIIVDDASNDDTPAKIAQYKAKDGLVRSVRHELNRKLPAALNTGFSHAKGDYLTWTSDDNCYRQHALAEMVAFLDSHSEVDGVYADFSYIDEKGHYLWQVEAGNREDLLQRNSIGPCFLYRRVVHEKIGGYAEDLFLAEDYDFWLRVTASFHLQHLRKDLYLYRHHPDSLTSTQARGIRLATERALARNLSQLKWVSRTTRGKVYLRLAQHALTSHDIMSVLRYWLLAMRYYPRLITLDSIRFLAESFPYFVKKQLRRVYQIYIARMYPLLFPIYEQLHAHSPFAIKLQTRLKPNFKIGMAVLAHERPEVLELCLDSLFQTNLYDYDITFLIQDDGSTDPRVREIIERERDPRYRIIRAYTPKGHNSWGAAFNKAMRKLMELDNFDIIGSCDSDALFHPEWLDKTIKICLWAKKNHKDHILGPFSSFNSSDYRFHQILGTYKSHDGNYVVKRRMGALNYFYFTTDFLKLGFFEEHKDDETLMTKKFEALRVRSFCTETSYVEHIGRISVLNEWRPTPVRQVVYGMNLVKHGWLCDMEKIGTLGYYKYIKDSVSSGNNVSSETKIDVIIMVVEKDLDVLPYVIDGVRENLKHPIGRIFVVAPDSEKIKALCADIGCQFVNENSLIPITKKDIKYVVDGMDRSGWLFQQLLKWSADSLSSQEYYLVIDADTVLIRPQVFEANGKAVFLHSDEHHQPYFEVYKELFGVNAPCDLSFVCHHMLYQKTKISELRKEIESKHGDSWYNVILRAIDKSELSSISEYETYGQWMLQNYGDEIIREYWYNIPIKRTKLSKLNKLKSALSSKYRSISFHSYLS
jgi:glycosyltransferase involved in cell wall biosynthesis